MFTTVGGTAVRQGSFRQHFWIPTVKKAKLKDPQPRVHDLRHSAASFMARAGFTLAEAGEQLGHSGIAMTQQYSHVFKDHRQEKAARLDALLGL